MNLPLIYDCTNLPGKIQSQEELRNFQKFVKETTKKFILNANENVTKRHLQT